MGNKLIIQHRNPSKDLSWRLYWLFNSRFLPCADRIHFLFDPFCITGLKSLDFIYHLFSCTHLFPFFLYHLTHTNVSSFFFLFIYEIHLIHWYGSICELYETFLLQLPLTLVNQSVLFCFPSLCHLHCFDAWNPCQYSKLWNILLTVCISSTHSCLVYNVYQVQTIKLPVV